jgi:hypothetical protein
MLNKLNESCKIYRMAINIKKVKVIVKCQNMKREMLYNTRKCDAGTGGSIYICVCSWITEDVRYEADLIIVSYYIHLQTVLYAKITNTPQLNYSTIQSYPLH